MQFLDWNNVTAEGRVAYQPGAVGPGGPPRMLGWNVPPEELQYIPVHWLSFPEPNPALHHMLALLYILFTFVALLGNGLVIWIFCA